MSIELIDLAAPQASESSTPSPDRLLSGTPQHTLANYFADGTQQFFAGRWSSTRGAWRIRYTESELCVILQGRVALTSASGVRREFGPGAAFVVPSGFEGIWEVIDDCTKLYAIFESRT
jgi:hypothetical protein